MREAVVEAELPDQGVNLMVGQAFYPEDCDGAGHLMSLASHRREAVQPAPEGELATPLSSLREALIDRRKVSVIQ